MVFNLLKIRLIQIYRIIIGVGLFRLLILCFILVPLFFLFLYQQLNKSDDTHYLIIGVILVIILFIHQKRKDYNFLLKISDSIIKTYYIEYVFFSIPFIVLFVSTYRLLDLGIYLFLLFVIILVIRPSERRARKTFLDITRFVPDNLFEWKAGIRQNIFIILPVYIIGLVGAFLSNTVTLGCAIILNFIICSFNSFCESREILEANRINASRFINNKLRQHLICWFVFILPILIFACFHYSDILYIIIAFATLINMYVCSIMLKYASYKSNKTSMTGSLFGSIVLSFSLIPGISVVVLVYNFFLYDRVIKKLDIYLNDYN